MEPTSHGINLSVVVPIWNDAVLLARLLPVLLQDWPAGSICVVDGGSSDESVAVAVGRGVRVLEMSRPSRAAQMNAGAAACEGEVILFLHADTQLPPGARERIITAVSAGAVGGAFARRFDHPSRILRATCRLADWRGRWFGVFLGDQAIFATRSGFECAGGFPEQPCFEDFEFSRRLSRVGRTVLVTPPAISSGRRFAEQGALRRTLSDCMLTVRYLVCGRTSD